MSQQHHHHPDGFDPVGDVRKGFNLLILVALILSLAIESLLRRPGTWGSRYWTGHAALSLFAMLLVCMATQPSDLTFGLPWAVPVVWGLVALATIAQGLEGAKKRRSGYRTHSSYSGSSIFPGNESFAKCVLEPGLVLAVGFTALFADVTLGCYLIAVAVSLSLVHSYLRSAELSRKRSMQDAAVMAEYDAGLMREKE